MTLPTQGDADLPEIWSSLAYLLLRFERFRPEQMPAAGSRGYSHERDLDAGLRAITARVGSGSNDLLVDALLDQLSNGRVHASARNPRWSMDRILGVKAIKYAHALATGRPELIPLHERRQVRARLEVAASTADYSHSALRAIAAMACAGDHLSPPEMVVGAQGPVDFRFTWRPWARHGTGDNRYAEATSLAYFEEVDHHDAPVVATLRTHTASGRLSIRSVEGLLVRPVLAPGSWEPATHQQFRDAARDGRAWADNPFLAPSTDRSSAYLSVDDIATPVRHPNRRDHDARAVAETECQQRAGRLFVIDGVVHKGTDMPRLHIVVSRIPSRAPFEWDAQVALAWSVGKASRPSEVDLATWVDQQTFCSRPMRDYFHVDWAVPRSGSRAGFAPELQDVLCRAITLFGADARNPGLQANTAPAVEGQGLPNGADFAEASAWIEAITDIPPPSSSRKMTTAQMWQAAIEAKIREAFADALRESVGLASAEFEADLALLM